MGVADLVLKREDRPAGVPGLAEEKGDPGQAERQPWTSRGGWTVEIQSQTPPGTGARRRG